MKLHIINRRSLGMEKQFHPTHYDGCNHLCTLGLKGWDWSAAWCELNHTCTVHSLMFMTSLDFLVNINTAFFTIYDITITQSSIYGGTYCRASNYQLAVLLVSASTKDRYVINWDFSMKNVLHFPIEIYQTFKFNILPIILSRPPVIWRRSKVIICRPQLIQVGPRCFNWGHPFMIKGPHKLYGLQSCYKKDPSDHLLSFNWIPSCCNWASRWDN